MSFVFSELTLWAPLHYHHHNNNFILLLLLFLVACLGGGGVRGDTPTTCAAALCDGVVTACAAGGSMGLRLNTRVTYTSLATIIKAFGANATITVTSTTSSSSTNHSTTSACATLNCSSNGTTTLTADSVSYVEFYGNYCRSSGAGFCPTVDVFSNVRAAQRMGEVARCHGMKVEFFTATDAGYRVSLDNLTYIYDNVPACNSVNALGRAYVSMLVLNVTMQNGLFKSQVVNGVPTLVGTELRRTCDSSAVCTLDAALPCASEKGDGKNGFCVTCVPTLDPTPTQAAAMDPSAFVVFLGTDAAGNVFSSSSSDPLRFRQFAAGKAYGVFTAAATQLANAIAATSSAYSSATNFNYSAYRARLQAIKDNTVLTVTNTISNLTAGIGPTSTTTTTTPTSSP